MASTVPTGNQIVPTTLEEYLALPYRLEIVRGEYGAFVVSYPDLPGCMTQVRRLEDAIPMAQEILEGWLELALEDGQDIPLPPRPARYSGRFLLRMPKSLHRCLAEAAAEEGVSLNAHISTLLAAGTVWRTANRRSDNKCGGIGGADGELKPIGEQPMEAEAEREAVTASAGSGARP